jgi:hypothetical protein
MNVLSVSNMSAGEIYPNTPLRFRDKYHVALLDIVVKDPRTMNSVEVDYVAKTDVLLQ